MKGFVNEFKEFISRGNVVDMAVGIIMGSAFTAIVTSLVNDIITPIVGMLCAGVNIADLSVKVGNANLAYGLFLQAIVNFLIISFVVFLMVKSINTIRDKMTKKKEEEKAAEEKADPQIELLTEIRDLLAKQEETK